MFNNPPQNTLPKNLPWDRLQESVARSGYPLQSVVAAQLKGVFAVTEEWGFPDRTTDEHRTLDVFAYKKLSQKNLSGVQLLGLAEDDFVFGGPCVCASFARVAGRGGDSGTGADTSAKVRRASGQKVKGLRLTGSDAYQGILLPLISAFHHQQSRPRAGGSSVYPSLTLAVCVVDAPMILAQGSPEELELSLAPWIRLVRQEPGKESWGFSRRHYVVDFVHRYALQEFIEEALRFADVFTERVFHHARVLAQGQGFVNELDGWSWKAVRPSR